MKTGSVGFISAIIYTSISLSAAALFFAITLAGSYDWVTRIGGASWIFLLSMIILMPVVTTFAKKRVGGN